MVFTHGGSGNNTTCNLEIKYSTTCDILIVTGGGGGGGSPHGGAGGAVEIVLSENHNIGTHSVF